MVIFLYVCLATFISAGCVHKSSGWNIQEPTAPCDTCIKGVTNFAKVTPVLWRGAQPTEEGFVNLEREGARTIVSLRAYHDDALLLQQTGLKYVSIRANAWHPEKEDMLLFLKVLEDQNNWPIFVHCAYGEDRTGYAIATYRIVEEGWSPEQAIKEMKSFHFNRIWFNNENFLRRIDVQEMKADLTPTNGSASSNW